MDGQQWLSAVRDVVVRTRVADLLDIGLIAVLAYGLIVWLQKARARFVALGLCALGGLYALSHVLEMHLSRWLFEAGLPLLLVALLVIFQEDLRRGFERVVLFGPRALRKVSPETIHTLVQTVERLSRQRVGALIVVRGREPLERHLTGGVELQGKLSSPLLYSLFDPHSAGHDGAVVVEGSSVRSFAVHLPLSYGLPPAQAGERGTRHAAALGLAERSDALVIAVSEERGTISVARDGQLWPVRDGTQLARELEAFVGGHVPRRSLVPQVRLPRAMPFVLKGAAVMLAGVAWFSFALQQSETVVHTLELPVRYRNVPAEWLVEQPEPKRVSVTLSAPKLALDRLDSEALALSIDLEGMQDGAHSVKVGAHNLELDPEISVQRLEPAHVRVKAHKTELRELPVQAQLNGRPVPGHVLKSRNVSPATLSVLVASEFADRLTHLSTEPIDLGELDQSVNRSVGVMLPEGARLAPDQPGKVSVQLDVKQRGAPDS